MSHGDNQTPIGSNSERATVLLLLIATALTIVVLAELTVVYAPFLLDGYATESQWLRIF